MSSSNFPKKREPDVVVDVVLRRAWVGKIGRILKTRLRLAQFKAERGWEDLSIDILEPKIDEIRRKAELSLTDDPKLNTFSMDTTESSSGNSSYFMNSPNENSFIFSDHTQSEHAWENSSYSSSRQGCHQRRSRENSDELCHTKCSRKRHCSSSPLDSSGKSSSSNKDFRNHRISPSSHSKFRRQAHFTTTSGPNLSFYSGSHFTQHAFDYHNIISDDEEPLPMNSFNTNSSSPQTPPINYCAQLDRSYIENRESFYGEVADPISHLACSPSLIGPARKRMPPLTPPPRNLALPSSMMFTPRSDSDLLFKFHGPYTPQPTFEFSDYVNMTPSSVLPNFDKSPNINQPIGTLDLMDTVDLQLINTNFFVGSKAHGTTPEEVALES